MANASRLSKPSRKGAPPKPVEAVANLQKPASGEKVPYQVKIKPETRRDFKTHAAAHDLDGSELFEIVWKYYREHHG
jgi:hypothetical protein